MGCLKIGGRVVGAQDGGINVDLPACYQSRATRSRLGCDAAQPGVPDDVTSGIIEALAAKLDASEMGRVLAVLADAGLISQEGASTQETAMDAASIMSRRREMWRNGKLSSSALHAPIAAPISAADERAFLARFPNAARLK